MLHKVFVKVCIVLSPLSGKLPAVKAASLNSQLSTFRNLKSPILPGRLVPFALYMRTFFRYKQNICTTAPNNCSGSEKMQPERKAGITIVFGVPAIVGAGLVWQMAGSWQAVFGYLGLLAFVLGGLLANPEQMISADNQVEQ